MDWARHLRVLLTAFAGALGAAFAFAVAMNPYGNLPNPSGLPHVIMDSNQRFQHPSIVRSGRYDSAVIGTSSARLLDPSLLERAFGGRFANLALDDGRAWEQVQLANLFVRVVGRPRTLLFAMDWVWCTPDADIKRITRRGFPDWLYDDSRWNDWLFVMNTRAVEIAGRKLGWYLGLAPGSHPANGFEVFVPPESEYDPERASRHIWGGPPRRLVAEVSGGAPAPHEVASWRYPAVEWLSELVARVPSATRVLFAFMPAHAAAQPVTGSRDAMRALECKRRVAEIALTRGAVVADFGILSPLTLSDANYWDPVHYRLPVARRIVAGIEAAASGKVRDPNGEWVAR